MGPESPHSTARNPSTLAFKCKARPSSVRATSKAFPWGWASPSLARRPGPCAALWGPNHQNSSALTRLQGCGSGRWSGGGLAPPRGICQAEVRSAVSIFSLPSARSFLYHFVSGVSPSGGKQDDGFLSRPALRKGLGPQPHGESLNTHLGPLCPHSQDTQFWWLSCEGIIPISIYEVPVHSVEMF